ncbi:hypothetical protein [Ancylobacter polymorphus]|uniref:Delta-60 repeat protein n=1 Tax=Ancylobacter polymorphus TaxID=223390 RepID=A0ABU0BEA2_9HYPH|nr:hypothetical protein [Ancylobacter polymorphus]MDQ0304173.1 putative delta-60 repeat protein [Ancylobacter polymorphus]
MNQLNWVKTRSGCAALAIAVALAWGSAGFGGAFAADATGPGSLDKSFGAGTADGTPDGVASTSLGDGDDIANGIATAPDGKVVVVGNRNNGKSNDIVVLRYAKDGTLDASFGKAEDGTPDGVVNISLGEGDDFATDVAVQTDGKIVVAGYHQEGASTNIAVLRLNTDGTLDSSFGKANDGTPDGVVNISLGDGNDIANAVGLTADGKVVIAGTTVAKDGTSNIVIGRLNTDGTADAKFGVDGSDGTPDGFTAVSLGDGNDVGEDLAVAQDGKIVVVGTHGPKGNTNIAVLRFTADGTLDPSFGKANDGTPDGVASFSLGDGSDEANAVALTADGKIVVAGDSVSKDGSTNVILARLNADGSLDEAFGVSEDGTPNGFVATSLGAGNDYATDVTMDKNGNIIVAGYHQKGSSTNIAVLRYNPKGELDEAFGTADDGTPNGIVNLSLGDGDDTANGVVMQGDALIVVGGVTTAKDGSKNITVVRLIGQ